MVIWPAFRTGQYRVNDHSYHAPQFNVSTTYIYVPEFPWIELGRAMIPSKNKGSVSSLDPTDVFELTNEEVVILLK